MKRVLLVEDENGARTVLSAALRARGLLVEAAADRAAGLALARESGYFDAVVVDVVLGAEEHGGLDLLEDLRVADITAPAIVITAFADKARLKRALELRVSYLLEKPFSADQLLGVLQRVWTETSDLDHYVRQALERANLTPRETDVARLVLKGLSNDEIAGALSNSEKTVRQHLSAVYAKCGVHTRSEFFHHVFPT